MKKYWILIFCIAFSAASFAQKATPSAKQVLTKAYATAKAEHKNILLIFHASWCVWCHKMDSSINSPACKKSFTDNYVITHLTVLESGEKLKLENKGADELLKSYKADKTGIPFWVILDQNGKLLKDSFIKDEDGNTGIIGCPANEKEVAAFVEILKATSSLTNVQLSIISSIFRKNESH